MPSIRRARPSHLLWVAGALGATVVSLAAQGASGGFAASIVNAPSLGSGTLIAMDTASGTDCVSSVDPISSDQQTCSGSLLPAGNIPPSPATLSGSATIADPGTVGGLATLSGTSCGALGASDASGHSDPGLLYGAIAGSSGPFAGSGSLALAGTTGWIGTTASSTDPAPVTIAGWFKTSSSQGGGILSFTGDQSTATPTPGNYGLTLWIDSSGKVVFNATGAGGGGANITSASAYNNGDWHLVVATYSAGPGGGAQLYLDGGVATAPAGGGPPPPPPPPPPPTYTGYWHLGWGFFNGMADAPTRSYLSGMLADVAIFPAQLTAAQVTALYQSAASQSEFAAAVEAQAPSSFWPLQDSGYLYPDPIPGAPARSNVCSSVGLTIQETSGGAQTCLLPARAGSCPPLTGAGDATLFQLAGNVLSLGNVTAGGSTQVVFTLTQEAPLPSGFSGLHPTLGVDVAITTQSWSAALSYPLQGLVL